MVIAGGEFRTEDLKGAREMMSLLLDDDELEEKRTWTVPAPLPRSPPRPSSSIPRPGF